MNSESPPVRRPQHGKRLWLSCLVAVVAGCDSSAVEQIVQRPITPAPARQALRPTSTEDRNAASVARPRLVVEETVHAFGEMSPREVRRHRFRFSNQGDAPLALGASTTNCKCVSHQLSHTTLSPGEEGSLELIWRGGDVEKERLTARVRVETNDPDQEVVEFTAVGKVTGLLSLGPNMLHADGVTPGDPLTLTSILSSDAWRAFEISAITLPHDSLSATPQALTPEEAQQAGCQSGWRLSIQAAGALTSQPFHGDVEVVACGPKSEKGRAASHRLLLPISWRPRQLLALSGPGVDDQGRIHLRIDDRGPIEKRFLLKVSDETPELAILHQKVTPDFVTAQLHLYRKNSKSALYRLEITVPQHTPSGWSAGSGRIHFEFEHPRIKQYDVGLELGASI